jgi:hypothetical protein
MRRKTPVLIAAVALAALAACGGEPTPTPTPTPEASVSATLTPTPTPSPTPTGHVRAPDDPNWTPNQLAAVQVVDGFREVIGAWARDPDNADATALLQLAANPQYLTEVNVNTWYRQVDRIIVGGLSVPVERTVGAETTVDGHQQIQVVQCQEDAPDVKAYQGGVEQDLGSPRVVYQYNVRWIEEDAGWRVVFVTKVSESC